FGAPDLILTNVPLLLPTPPANHHFISVASTTLSQAWTAVGGADNYRLRKRVNMGTPSEFLVGNITSFTDASLTPNTSYSYQVMGVLDPFSTLPSIEITTMTLAAIPGALNNLLVGTSSLDAGWDSAGNPNGTKYTVRAD